MYVYIYIYIYSGTEAPQSNRFFNVILKSISGARKYTYNIIVYSLHLGFIHYFSSNVNLFSWSEIYGEDIYIYIYIYINNINIFFAVWAG